MTLTTSRTAQPAASPSPRSRKPPPGGRPARPGVRHVGYVVLATLTVVAALVMLGGALVLRAADGALRNDGYVTSDPVRVSTSAYALVITDGLLVERADIGGLSARSVGTVRVTATGSGQALFVGIADSRRVRGYLAGVRRATLTELSGPGGGPSYLEVSGGPPTTPPADLPFWRASSWGGGTHVVSTGAADGPWSVVVMNLDGSAGVAADLRVGATLPVLRSLATGAAGAGLVLLAAGAVAMTVARARTV